PEKIELVSDGIRKIPRQKTPITTIACRPYTMYRSSVIPGGNVVKYWKMNRSKIIKKASATTGRNEYWRNALNHDQNNQSSFGTIRNGTKIGPSNAHTALAIRPNATIASERTLAMVTAINNNQYRRFARIAHVSGWMKCCDSSSRWSNVSSSERASSMFAKLCVWSVMRLLNDTPIPGIGDS